MGAAAVHSPRSPSDGGAGHEPVQISAPRARMAPAPAGLGEDHRRRGVLLAALLVEVVATAAEGASVGAGLQASCSRPRCRCRARSDGASWRNVSPQHHRAALGAGRHALVAWTGFRREGLIPDRMCPCWTCAHSAPWSPRSRVSTHYCCYMHAFVVFVGLGGRVRGGGAMGGNTLRFELAGAKGREAPRASGS